MGISVIIHTYNNENIIRNCLEAVKDFDEIVVCDMYSNDKTLEIVKEYNCKIVMHNKIDYVEPARNFAIQQASNEWVLIVDSDEIISAQLKDYLYKFIKNNKKYNAVKIPRLNYYWGVKIEIQYPDYVTRFIKKEKVNWPSQIHSQPIIEGEIYTIPKSQRELAIKHHCVSTIKQLFESLNVYTDKELEKMINKKQKMPNVFWAFFKSLFLIFEKFILKKGYKSGADGFILCTYFGLYKFIALIKYREFLIKNLENKND